MKIPELIEQQKYLFATYSTMALMNIQTVLNHIQKLVNLDGISNERKEDYWEHPVIKHLENASFGDKNPEKTKAVMEKLLQCFPFLKVMAENQREYSNKKRGEQRFEINNQDMFKVLDTILRVLKGYRDCSCHYFFKDGRWDDGSIFLRSERSLAIMMDNYYDVALSNVKEKYNYTTEQLAFIQNHRKKKIRGNLNFFLSIKSNNNDRTGQVRLSGVGVALLICLFLEKKYINSFISKIHINGKYPTDSEESRVIRRSMAINSIRLPRERIKSDKKGMAIAMDMLNELKRCPKELFETFSYGDQSHFRIVSSDYNEVLQMRSTDRFAQLVLQYIDYNRLFVNLRFHVNMGKLRYLFSANKLCIDGQSRVRIIEHQINGFGRIDELEEYRKSENGTYGNSNIIIRDFENTRRDDADESNYPYIVDTYSRYLLDNNKVEMCFSNDKIVPNIVKDRNGKWYVEKTIPSCRLSTLELPAMMFHMLLLGSKVTEERIKKVYGNYLKLFESLREGTLTSANIDSFGIARADIPQKVMDAVNGVTNGKDYDAFVEKTLEEMLDDTINRLSRLKESKRTINSSSNKMGKPGFRQLSAGRIADYLAEDIIKFQPSARKGDNYGSDKMTGMNYRVMQATIATFSSNGETDAFCLLEQMFRKAGLLGGTDGKQAHPFLGKALLRKPQNTIDLYENYLYAKKRYLENKRNDIDEGRRVRIACVNYNKSKWAKRDSNFYSTLGDIYLEDIPIELPRQMFDEDIKNALRKIPEMNGIDFDNANVTYLIGEYMRRTKNDGAQQFYSWNRNYRYMDFMKCETDAKNSLCKQYTTVDERKSLWESRNIHIENYIKWALKKKRADRKMSGISDYDFEEKLTSRVSACRNEYQKTEKLIRRYKVQDILMFMMVEKELKKNLDFDAKNLKLMDIMPDADKGILSETMPMDFIFEKGGKKYTIHSDGMKLKNYGDFFALANDKRMVSLLDILNTDTVDKDNIEQELDNYDTCRPNAVKLILDFEKLALEKYPEMKRLATPESHFDFKVILEQLISRGDLNKNDTWILSQIRNAFNHNQYPKNGIIEVRTLPEIANHLLELFGQHAQLG